MFALLEIMKVASKEPAVKVFRQALMTKLEGDDQVLGRPSKDEAQVATEQQALQIFQNADEFDRGGRQDKFVAQAFYAAYTLFEVTTQFGDLSPDVRPLW